MNNSRRNADFDWLYSNPPESGAEHTRVFTPEERARIAQDAAPGPGPASPSEPPGTPPPPPQQPPRTTRRRRKRRRPFLRFILLLALAYVLFLIGTPIYAWTAGTSLPDAMPTGERPAEQPGTAILLVGSDGRDDLTDEERRELGTGSADGNRADTMMLLYRPPTGRSVVMSLPRDSYVEIPGRGGNKLNAAYAFGGPPLLIETIEHNTGIRVDGYLEVGFLGVVRAVDAVGGIEVCLDEPIQDRDSHLDLPAGCQTLDGVDALGYVRMRKSDPRGDLGRVERQREVVGTVMHKILSPMTFINPKRYWEVSMAASSSLARNEGFGIGGLFSAGSTFVGSAFGNGISVTVPVAGTGDVSGVGSVVRWDEAASRAVFDAIIRGETEPLEVYER